MNNHNSLYTTILHLGSNQGEPLANLEEALSLIQKKIGSISNKSSFYKTAAWGNTDQPDFLNVAVCVQTTLSPLEVLETALAIENTMGRVRVKKWGQRLIDIDVVFYEQEIINSQVLTLPHPLAHERAFVLIPLAEIIPNYIHPVFAQTVDALLDKCRDNLEVEKIRL